MRIRFSAFLLFAALPLCAQQPHIAPDTPATTETLQQWLHSNDPRLVAWAATLAHRDHNAEVIAQMPDVLDHWSAPLLGQNDKSRVAWIQAADAILDTLIQENIAVPPSTIRTLADSFPDQAIILIARLPLSQTASLLQHWTYGWNQRSLARLATMMLAAAPHPTNDVVQSVLTQSELDLQIEVAKSAYAGRIFGTTCGDSISRKPTPEWPLVYDYGLEENNTSYGTLVFELDGDRITYRRFEVNSPGGSCNGIQILGPTTRHRILAHWLGVSPQQMSWQPVEPHTIIWKGKADYDAQLAALIESSRARLSDTVNQLRSRQILTSDKVPPPRLVVSITCEINPCPLDK